MTACSDPWVRYARAAGARRFPAIAHRASSSSDFSSHRAGCRAHDRGTGAARAGPEAVTVRITSFEPGRAEARPAGPDQADRDEHRQHHPGRTCRRSPAYDERGRLTASADTELRSRRRRRRLQGPRSSHDRVPGLRRRAAARPHGRSPSPSPWSQWDLDDTDADGRLRHRGPGERRAIRAGDPRPRRGRARTLLPVVVTASRTRRPVRTAMAVPVLHRPTQLARQHFATSRWSNAMAPTAGCSRLVRAGSGRRSPGSIDPRCSTRPASSPAGYRYRRPVGAIRCSRAETAKALAGGAGPSRRHRRPSHVVCSRTATRTSGGWSTATLGAPRRSRARELTSGDGGSGRQAGPGREYGWRTAARPRDIARDPRPPAPAPAAPDRPDAAVQLVLGTGEDRRAAVDRRSPLVRVDTAPAGRGRWSPSQGLTAGGPDPVARNGTDAAAAAVRRRDRAARARRTADPSAPAGHGGRRTAPRVRRRDGSATERTDAGAVDCRGSPPVGLDQVTGERPRPPPAPPSQAGRRPSLTPGQLRRPSASSTATSATYDALLANTAEAKAGLDSVPGPVRVAVLARLPGRGGPVPLVPAVRARRTVRQGPPDRRRRWRRHGGHAVVAARASSRSRSRTSSTRPVRVGLADRVAQPRRPRRSRRSSRW